MGRLDQIQTWPKPENTNPKANLKLQTVSKKARK